MINARVTFKRDLVDLGFDAFLPFCTGSLWEESGWRVGKERTRAALVPRQAP